MSVSVTVYGRLLKTRNIWLFFLFYFSSPRKARAFNELRRYHTRPRWFNCGPENVHFGKTHLKNLNINAKILFIFCVFDYCTLKRPKKWSKVQKTPKNDKIIIPTFCRYYIRTNVQEIVVNTKVDFCGEFWMDTLKKWLVWKNLFSVLFLPNYWTLKILLLP